MSSNIQIERICEYCGKTFIAQTTVTKFCSHKCNSKAYKAKVRSKKVEQSMTETRSKLIKPIEELSKKPFLSIDEVSILVGISRKTIYNLINKGDLKFGKLGNRTIIRRMDIDTLLERYIPLTAKVTVTENQEYYSVKEIEEQYLIKYGRLNEIVKEYSIPKRIFNGKLYLSKTHIDNYFAKVKNNVNTIKEWYTVDDVMSKYGLTREGVYRITSEKQIPKKKVGKYNLLSQWHIDNLGLIFTNKTNIA